jgi:hypothetical protein
MMVVACANCGREFQAQRKTAKYCTSACRVAATRKRQRDAAPAPRREGAQVYALPPVSDAPSEGFHAATQRQLEEAGRAESYQGRAALFAARILDSGVQDTMSSMATMLREYKASMREALEGVRAVDDPVESILARRQKRVSA